MVEEANSDEIQKQHKAKRKVKIQTAVARVKAKSFFFVIR